MGLKKLLKREEEGHIEDLLEDSPSHPKPSVSSSQALAPLTPILTRLDPSKPIT
ncbi:hypothetical protein ACLOJK_008187 [Asimina triloba]